MKFNLKHLRKLDDKEIRRLCKIYDESLERYPVQYWFEQKHYFTGGAKHQKSNRFIE
jgi:hypothetical protein